MLQSPGSLLMLCLDVVDSDRFDINSYARITTQKARKIERNRKGGKRGKHDDGLEKRTTLLNSS